MTTSTSRTIHPLESDFINRLSLDGVIPRAELVILRSRYLGSEYPSILAYLRAEGRNEEALAAALVSLGFPFGGEGAVADPLHRSVIHQRLPYDPVASGHRDSRTPPASADPASCSAPHPTAPPLTVSTLPDPGARQTYETIGDALAHLGVILTQDEYRTRDIDKVLLNQGRIDEETLTKARALKNGLPYIDLRRHPADLALKDRVSSNTISLYKVIPYDLQAGVLRVAIHDPSKAALIRNSIEDERGECPALVVAPPSQLLLHIQNVYEKDAASSLLRDEAAAKEARSNRPIHDGSDASIVATKVDQLIRNAASVRASDIHIEPTEQDTHVRYRVDGALELVDTLPKNMHDNIINRIRSLGNLSPSGNRRPQDAMIRYRERELNINLRLNIVPGVNGGAATMRLSQPSTSIPKIDSPGMALSARNLELVQWATRQPNGMIITSGPTGSGKTVFSHSVLQELNTPDRAIFTIENPVEIEIPGIQQVQINPDVPNEEWRTDFPDILRALLRQDPDVIMIGEVRDLTTASVSVQAAMTGHLMITTIHSNTAAGVVVRLMDMGVETFNLASALRLLIAQRLAGRPCPDCRTSIPTPPGLFAPLEALGHPGPFPTTLLETNGRLHGSPDVDAGRCPTCRGSGRSGRVGIHEMFRVTASVEQAIRAGATERDVEALARADGYRTLWEDGLQKLLDGHTTLRLLMGAISDAAADPSASAPHAAD